MREPDPLAALAADLEALPPRQWREVLGALKPFERARVEALLKEARAPAGDRQEEPRAEFAGYSSWLAKRFREARDGDQTGSLTPDARRLLLKVAAEAPAAVSAPMMAPSQAGSRSLVGALGGFLSSRRRHR